MNGHGKFCLVGVPNLLVPKKKRQSNGFVGFKIVSLGAFQVKITYFLSEGKKRIKLLMGTSEFHGISGVLAFFLKQTLYNPIYPI